MTSTDTHKAIASALIRQWQSYPSERRSDVGIVAGSRHGTGLGSEFVISVLTYSSRRDDWKQQIESMPQASATLKVAGSGANEVRRTLDVWNTSHAANTSRAVFSAFCEAVASGRDPLSGGPPQLVGLHRQGPGKSFGIVADGKRYLSGADVVADEHPRLMGVEWFSPLFERVDAATKKRLSGAQVHVGRLSTPDR